MSTLLSDLNPEQQKAVQHKDGPCLVVAGAGTGKTMVITRRIAWLIEQGIAKPEEIIALTFTDKAAREMEERVDQLVDYGQTGSTISTFHSFAAQIIRDEAYLLGIPSNFNLYTKAEEIVLARKLLFDFPLKIIKPGSDPSQFLRHFITFISRLKDENVYPDEFTAFIGANGRSPLPEEDEQTAIWQELADCYQIYQKRLNQEGALGFADLIPYALKLIDEHQIVRDRLQKSIKYLLIDEYQDTNWAQAELAYRLIEKTKNIFVVGDDDQAIYAFRGAAVGNILNFTKKISQTKIIVLTQNYRSTQEILDTSYRLIQFNNPQRLEFVEKIDKRLIGRDAIDRVSTPPEFKLFTSQTAESSYIADWIIEKTNKKSKINLGDITILVRSRNQAENILTSLRARGIRHILVSDRRFYEFPIIKLALCYLRLLANPQNSANLFYILTSDLYQIGESDLKNYISKIRYFNHYLFDYLKKNIFESSNLTVDEKNLQDRVKPFFDNFAGHLKLIKDEPASLILLKFIHDLGLYEKLTKKLDLESMAQIEQLGLLYETITAYEERHLGATLDDYIDYLNSVIESGEDIAPPDMESTDPTVVKIMTVHQSKGLEFPIVIIPSAAKNRFPSTNRKDKFLLPDELIKERVLSNVENKNPMNIHLQEERRLFYVACTRAKDELLITAAKKYGSSDKNFPISPFVQEAFGENLKTDLATVDQAQILQLALPFDQQEDRRKKTRLRQDFGGQIEDSSSSQITNYKLQITSLSPSKLETFYSCPYKYRYQYVLKLKVLPSWQINFGTSVHNALKAYYDQLRTNNDDIPHSTFHIQNLIDSCWIPGGYESKAHEEQKKQEALRAIEWFVKSDRGVSIPDLTEVNFAFQLPTKDKITGRIDRIDRNSDGSLTIVDYKTGSYVPTKKEVLANVQLAVYALALEEKKEKIKDLGLVFPMVQKEIFLTREELDLEAFKQKISDSVQEVKEVEVSNDYQAKPTKLNCDWCDYNKICPFRFQ